MFDNQQYTGVSALDMLARVALVPIPRGLKGPNTRGWNPEENAVRTKEQAGRLNGGNLGIRTRWCGTCAIDADNLEWSRELLRGQGSICKT